MTNVRLLPMVRMAWDRAAYDYMRANPREDDISLMTFSQFADAHGMIDEIRPILAERYDGFFAPETA